ncbi:MAG: RNA 2',3'-cyclic phosphodiesterase [Candidatus Omnitrophica bacterium CG23_combo_of_CG06-09_8_20_14_all_40_11]|nr:MAG: RNA 2',3'-cyclic phosphodiesterase [Candidatus Omnitrophica bacterium CG23_combo_of_CG06-09_8_20_14_all_40_11]
MRTFIAIELPKEIKDSLSRLQEQLKATHADVKWVAPENIHLTLKFLGEIDDKKLEKIVKIIFDTAREKSKFQLRISSLGAFPKIDFPRIIWVGVDIGDKETRGIAEELEQNLAKIGIPKEDRPFSSHITIGRIRSSLNRERLVQDLKNKAELGGQNLDFYATSITLFKSTLTPKGPIYEILKETNLKKPE